VFAEKLLKKAGEYLDRQEFDKAISIYNKIINRDNAQAGALLGRGIAYHGKCIILLQNTNSDEEALSLTQKYLTLAINDFDKAITMTHIYFNSKPQMLAEIFHSRAYTNFYLQKFEDAVKDCNEAISSLPSDIEAYILKGVLYLEPIQDPATAIDIFTQAIKVSPDYRAYFHRAQAYYDQKEKEKAFKDFERAIKINPEVKQWERTTSIYNYHEWERFKEEFAETHPWIKVPQAVH